MRYKVRIWQRAHGDWYRWRVFRWNGEDWTPGITGESMFKFSARYYAGRAARAWSKGKPQLFSEEYEVLSP